MLHSNWLTMPKHLIKTPNKTGCNKTNGVCGYNGWSSISLLDHQVHAPKSGGNHWECSFPPDQGHLLRIEQGVFKVYRNQEDMEKGKPISYQCPSLEEFVKDLQKMCTLIADGPLKTFSYKRLVYLSSKFQLHGMLNEIR